METKANCRQQGGGRYERVRFAGRDGVRARREARALSDSRAGLGRRQLAGLAGRTSSALLAVEAQSPLVMRISSCLPRSCPQELRRQQATEARGATLQSRLLVRIAPAARADPRPHHRGRRANIFYTHPCPRLPGGTDPGGTSGDLILTEIWTFYEFIFR